MVDDLLCVSECGFRTKSLHAFLTFKTESKKLQFGAEKCKKLHVGKRVEGFKCQTLKVDHWKEIETGSEKIEDICDEEYEMEKSQEWLRVLALSAKSFQYWMEYPSDNITLKWL